MALKEQLADWLEAGVVDRETAARIDAFEASRKREAPGGEGITSGEVIAYIGTVVLLVGVGFLYGTQYRSLGSAGRLVIIALVALAGLAAGELVRRTGAGTGASRRARAAGWSIGAVGTGAWFAQALVEAHVLTRPGPPYPGAPEDTSGAVMAGAAIGCLLAAFLLWQARAGLLAVVTAALGCATSGAFDAYFMARPSAWGGEATWLLPALAWAGFAELLACGRGGLWAREILRFAAVLPPLVAALILSTTPGGGALEWFAALLALAGFALAYWRASAAYAIAGGVGLFIVVNEVGFRHFASSVGFPVVLIASGITLLAIAGALFRLRSVLGRLRR